MKTSPTNPPVVRALAPEEARHISALALRSKAYWGYSSEFIEACREELTYSGEQILSPEFSFAAAEIGRIIVGFYALRKMPPREFELEALFVEPAYIGHGIGRILLNHAKHAALEAGADSLLAQVDPNAESFYTIEGGRKIGQRPSDSIPDRMLPLFLFELE